MNDANLPQPTARRDEQPRARISMRSPLLAALLLLASVVGARAANPTPVQLFYVPFPEDQFLQGLQAIELGGSASAPTNPVTTYISIAAVADGTIVYYDQWENGYDADIANPIDLYSGGNPDGTQIWGDGNPANGAPPGIPGDVIDAGTVIVLNNDVVTTNLSAIDFDGRDKLAATRPVAVTHTGWADGSDTLLAGSVEVLDTSRWGTEYLAPVGADIPDATDHQMFEYTSLAIMAGEGGAVVQIDKDANGVFETTVNLNEGESHFVDGGVNVGGRVSSDNPVQVDILTGDIASNYESRDSSLLPVNLWSSSSYTPVSTTSTAQSIAGTGTTVWLYNPGASALTVAYTTRDGGGSLTTTNLSVPGGPAGGYLPQVIPDGYGAHFATGGAPFYAFSATNSTDPSTSGNQAWDWGFTLVPEDSLTPQVLIGLGIGRDPTSPTNPNENGNPVWVTTVGNGDTAVTVYVDFDADPSTGALTDPNLNKYDLALSLKELERAKVYDTGDRNQTGMLLYTLTPGVKLAAAWGQDPTTATASAPGLDVGTGVPPLPLFSAGKNGTLAVDNDGDGFVSPGDVLLYTIVITNISRAPVDDVLLQDDLPAGTTYVPNSTFFENASNVVTPIPDDGVGTAFPLDGGGVVLDSVNPLPVGGSYEVTFQVTIVDFDDLPPGTTAILNTCEASADGTTILCPDTTPLFGRIGDFVWNDIDGDGVQDGGAEVGIPGVSVQLIDDANGNGVFDGGDTVIATQVTSGSGGYLFTGLPPGDYIVNVVDATVPAGYVLTTANDPTAVDLAAGEVRLDVDFGYRDATPTGSIGDFVWNDIDGDGVQDGGAEVGIPGVSVQLIDDANGNGVFDGGDTVIATQVTSGSGGYLFTGLPPGDYIVNVVDATVPAGLTLTTANDPTAVDLAAGESRLDVDFGYRNLCIDTNGQPVVCTNGDQCNDPGICDPQTGTCSAPVPHGGACSDGNGCTQTDTCQGGLCVGGNPVTCTPLDACHVAGICDPQTGTCSNPNAPNGTACASDGNVCTTDVCQGGACVHPPGNAGTLCRAVAGQCDVAEVCDGTNTACPPDASAPDGTPCDDGLMCTLADQCMSGVCQGTSTSCGDGATNCGEQCDDGNTTDGDGCSSTCQLEEICLDQTDNDGDGLIDCLDPECPCEDLINVCKHPCLSKLLIKKKLDREQIQTSFVPLTPIDPVTETFTLLVTNANGVVYSQTIPPGSFYPIGGGGWFYKNRLAPKLGGLLQVKIQPDVKGINPNAVRIALKGYGELTGATLSTMTVQIAIGNDAFYATTDWDTVKTGGWATWLPAGIP